MVSRTVVIDCADPEALAGFWTAMFAHRDRRRRGDPSRRSTSTWRRSTACPPMRLPASTDEPKAVKNRSPPRRRGGGHRRGDGPAGGARRPPRRRRDRAWSSGTRSGRSPTPRATSSAWFARMPRRLGGDWPTTPDANPDVTTTSIPPDQGRSWWLREALAQPQFAGEPAPPLTADTTADVVILGGGYTGMWTAWFTQAARPGHRRRAAGAGHLRRRAERSQRRLRGLLLERAHRALRALRRRRGDAALPCRRGERDRDRRVLRRARRRRLVPPRRRPERGLEHLPDRASGPTA